MLEIIKIDSCISELYQDKVVTFLGHSVGLLSCENDEFLIPSPCRRRIPCAKNRKFSKHH